MSQDRLSGYLEFKDDLKFNLRLNKRINTDLNSPINCVSNIDSNYLAVGAQDGSINVYSVNNGQLVGGHKTHTDQVFSLGNFREKDNFYIVSTGYGADNRIVVWKLFTSSPFMQLSDGNSTHSCMAFHSEHQRNMVTGTLDNSLCVWDLANGKLARKIQAHKSQVSNVRYLPTIEMFASSGWDNMIKLWKIEYKIDEYHKLISNLLVFQQLENDSAVLSLNSCQIDSTFLLAGSSNHRITVWNLSTGTRENELETNTTANEIVLVENMYAYASPDFMVLNTNSLDETSQANNQQGNTRGGNFNPRVQLLEIDSSKHKSLKLAKVGGLSTGGYCINIYDII